MYLSLQFKSYILRNFISKITQNFFFFNRGFMKIVLIPYLMKDTTFIITNRSQ